MKISNIPIIGKVLLVLGTLAVAWIGSSVFTASKMRQIADGYSAAIEQEGSVALFASRGNRALAFMQASVAELEVSFTDEGNRRALAQIDDAVSRFKRFMQIADKADPTGVWKLKDLEAQGLQIIGQTCKNAIELGSRATEGRAALAAQTEYLKSCGPAFDTLVASLTKTVDGAVVAQATIQGNRFGLTVMKRGEVFPDSRG